jgi:hypothetical protein
MNLVLILFYAQPINTFSEENILAFADHLYIQKDYAAALNEYQRYQFLTDSIRDDVPDRIVECLINLEMYDEALAKCNDINDEVKRRFTKGTVYFTAEQYDLSRTHLIDIGEYYNKEANKIIGLSYAFEFRFQEAEEYLKLPRNKLTYKKPGLGALCVLFPGGGHWYCGRFGDGMFSFFLIGTSALLSYYYHHENEDIKYGICLGATGLFYIANIYGGINAVRNYNYYQNEKYLEEIIESTE